jgi:hypothetical protein
MHEDSSLALATDDRRIQSIVVGWNDGIAVAALSESQARVDDWLI